MQHKMLPTRKIIYYGFIWFLKLCHIFTIILYFIISQIMSFILCAITCSSTEFAMMLLAMRIHCVSMSVAIN